LGRFGVGAAVIPPPSDPDLGSLLLGLGLMAVIYGTFGAACAWMAKGRGRSPVAWFFIGFLTQCLGVILLLLLPNPRLDEEKQRQRTEETRRLREQLKKDRRVADERHESHRQRLGAHDRALGVDTAAAEPALPGSEPPMLPGSGPAVAAPDWYYATGSQRLGPVTAAVLGSLWRERRIDASTLVWCQGMTDWASFASVRDLFEERSA
jgi:hypothetical protein